jgi:hypothetical protein
VKWLVALILSWLSSARNLGSQASILQVSAAAFVVFDIRRPADRFGSTRRGHHPGQVTLALDHPTVRRDDLESASKYQKKIAGPAGLGREAFDETPRRRRSWHERPKFAEAQHIPLTNAKPPVAGL